MTYDIMSDVNTLDDIAYKVYDPKRGGYLSTFAQVWIMSGIENKRILWAAWIDLILKYRLCPVFTAKPKAETGGEEEEAEV